MIALKNGVETPAEWNPTEMKFPDFEAYVGAHKSAGAEGSDLENMQRRYGKWLILLRQWAEK